MSNRKNRERAERGLLFRNGHLVSKEEAQKIDEGRRTVSQLKRNPMSILGMMARRRIGYRPAVPDLRCPWCDSSRMAKEGLDTCPECGYQGDPVDKNAQVEEATAEEQSAMIAGAYKCADCGEPAQIFVGETPYCQKHAEELAARLEAENGKEDSQAVHNADTSGGDERGEASGEGGDPGGGEETRS